jgi:hypothetical protein
MCFGGWCSILSSIALVEGSPSAKGHVVYVSLPFLYNLWISQSSNNAGRWRREWIFVFVFWKMGWTGEYVIPISNVCVHGEERKGPAQGNLLQARLVSSLVISNVAGIITPGVGKTRAWNIKPVHSRAAVTETNGYCTRFTCVINHLVETGPMRILFLRHSSVYVEMATFRRSLARLILKHNRRKDHNSTHMHRNFTLLYFTLRERISKSDKRKAKNYFDYNSKSLKKIFKKKSKIRRTARNCAEEIWKEEDS